MEFKEAIVHVLNNYATFTGRARRSEYWYWALFIAIVSGAISLLMNLCAEGSILRTLLTGIDSLFSLAVLVPGLAVCWRRLHDIGKSGANWFWVFLPVVGWIMLIVWFCKDSQPGENQYGPNPKEIY